MYAHPFFALQLHDDEELSAFLPAMVTRRETLHEWPLSCVQRLHCEDGQTFIYKVQSAPTVEPDFYAQARSQLVVTAQVIPMDGAPAALLLAELHAPRLDAMNLTAEDAFALADQILDGIDSIDGDLPALDDIRSEDGWRARGDAICADLRALVDDGSFQQVTVERIEQVAATIHAEDVRETLRGKSGYVHGDLRAENILVTAQGMRVLDWQRPIWGPVALDRLALLSSLGIGAAAQVATGVRRLQILLQIGWLAQCAHHWFPPGVPTYDAQIAQLIADLD